MESLFLEASNWRQSNEKHIFRRYILAKRTKKMPRSIHRWWNLRACITQEVRQGDLIVLSDLKHLSESRPRKKAYSQYLQTLNKLLTFITLPVNSALCLWNATQKYRNQEHSSCNCIIWMAGKAFIIQHKATVVPWKKYVCSGKHWISSALCKKNERERNIYT